MIGNSPGALIGKDCSGQDFRNKDLTGNVLFGTDMRGAKLNGVRVSLECKTFDGVQLDDSQVAVFLLMLQTADINPEWQDGLRDLVRRVSGEKAFETLSRYLKIV
jgi:hypothetical protein